MLSLPDVQALCTKYRATAVRVDDTCLHVSVPLGRDEEEAVYGLKARLAHAGYQVLCYRTGRAPQLGVLGRLTPEETREEQRDTARTAENILTDHLNRCDDMGMNVSQESDAMLSLMRLVNQLIDG